MKTIPENSPLLFPAGEMKRRWSRWRRRYPNIDAWLKAHPGEAAGGLAGVWVHKPETWANGRSQPSTHNQAVKRIRAQMSRLGVTMADLAPELAIPKPNGHAKPPQRNLTPADAGWTT